MLRSAKFFQSYGAYRGLVKVKEIRITCQGAGTAALEDLVPLQGGLKKLDSDRYKKLKRALLKHGFSFPFFVWKSEGKLHILDGHQRDVALKRLKSQGYTIPPLPIDFIEAASEKEAKEKILLLSSQYGQMTDESALAFMRESELDIDDLLGIVDLPQIDLEKLSERLEKEISDNPVEQPPLDYQYQVIVDCKDEAQQLALIEKLEKQKYTCRALIL